MRLPLFRFWQAMRSSYWFLPSVMAVAAIGLGALMVWLDAGVAAGLLEPLGWYQQSKPEGARAVLSAIAGSMITVAGVVFSITIVAISYAASQYGPRILTNFMSDRGNQVTLGTFIATFVYSVVVLRTIQGGEQSSFVPQLALFGAMLLALCSLAVLIYFIHHVPQSIHVNHVVANIGRQLIGAIDQAFPACFGDPPAHSDGENASFARAAEAAFGRGRHPKALECRANGYLQALDEDHLLSVACKHDLIIAVDLAPGQFVYDGRAVALAAPAVRVTEDVEKAIREAFAVGASRTPDQDLQFLIDELVEIAARALSTGVNDPYTAMTCADWLMAAAIEKVRRQPPSPYRLDEKGELRVVARSPNFEAHLDRGFGHYRPYAAGDVNAAAHFLSRIALIASEARSDEQHDALAREAEALFELARKEHGGPSLERLEKEMAETRAAILRARSRPDQEPRDATGAEGANHGHRQAAGLAGR
jgi:uncharacterized membrane protein